jgi:hypothetical protein
MEQVENVDLVEETIRIFKHYRDHPNRVSWVQHLKEDREFRFGKQWTAEQIDALEARGQAPIVVNRIHPAVETAKALLTSRKPCFMASAREDSDNKVAKIYDSLLEYVWDISDGNAQLRTIIDDSYVGSMGYAFVYHDIMADYGKGEVKFMSIDPLDVFVDPLSRNRLFDDAENIIVSREFTKAQAKKYKPLFDGIIDSIPAGSEADPYTGTGREDDNAVVFPEDIIDTSFGEDETIRGYERYQMVFTVKYRVYDSTDGKEQLLTENEMVEYLSNPVWIINGSVFKDPEDVNRYIETFMQESGQQPEIQQLTIADLVKMGAIKTIKIRSKNIRVICVMGEELLYIRELPPALDKYPIIPFPSFHTGTPFPTSDVRMVKGLQEYINKIRSLIIAHASTSTNVKILIPRGSMNKDDLERQWAKPGVVIEYEPSEGQPIPVPPAQLPNELYHNERQAMEDINHQFGIYEMMMGDANAAPQTYKATISLDDFGQRKIRSKLSDIETSLRRLAEVIIPFIQQLYTQEKTVRLVQPNNSITEITINHQLIDDKTAEIKAIENDISKGSYDIKVITGSTLPSNRYAELELHMECYKVGIIDQQEVLKKTDIYDKEGILERTSLVKRLQAALQQMDEENKKMKGDLQTLEREIMHAKQDAELAKFKAGLKETEASVGAAKELYKQRLSDSKREFDKDLGRELEKQKETGRNSK